MIKVVALQRVDWRFQVLRVLGEPAVGRVLSTAELLDLVRIARPSAALMTARGAIDGLEACGALEKVSHGLYVNRVAQPPVSLLELAQVIRHGCAISLESVLHERGALREAPVHVTAVVPLSESSRPNVGKVTTTKGFAFRFHALPQWFWPTAKRDERLLFQTGRQCAVFVPEAAALQLAYLANSPRSSVSIQPGAVDVDALDEGVLSNLAHRWDLEHLLQDLRPRGRRISRRGSQQSR